MGRWNEKLQTFSFLSFHTISFTPSQQCLHSFQHQMLYTQLYFSLDVCIKWTMVCFFKSINNSNELCLDQTSLHFILFQQSFINFLCQWFSCISFSTPILVGTITMVVLGSFQHLFLHFRTSFTSAHKCWCMWKSFCKALLAVDFLLISAWGVANKKHYWPVTQGM